MESHNKSNIEDERNETETGVKLNRFNKSAFKAGMCRLSPDSQFSLESTTNVQLCDSTLAVVVIVINHNNNLLGICILGLHDRDGTALKRAVNFISAFFACATYQVIIERFLKSMQLLHHSRVPRHSIVQNEAHA